MGKQKSTSRGQFVIIFTVSSVLIFICGCGDFFEKKDTEMRTRQILNELEKIRENPHVSNPLPEMYRGEPNRVESKDGVTLYYFTKHHTVDKLQGIITAQHPVKVTIQEATNQLIIQCSDNEQADRVEDTLSRVDIPPIPVNIDCLIVERFADVTLDWSTTLLIENLLGEEITLGEGKYGGKYPTFPGAVLREETRGLFGLDFGYWRDKGVAGHQFRLVIDILESRGYLKVLMNPVLETINGKKALISSREYAPLQKMVSGKNIEPYNVTEYQWVEDKLEVTPHVFADGSVGLVTNIQIASRSKPEGVIQVSIITERKINQEENRIRPGDSLIIGGLRESEKRSVIRGAPFLKDLPIIGAMFSSKDYEEKATELTFILTPSISSGGMEHAKMIDEIKRRHGEPEYEPGWEERLTDPLGLGTYTKQVEKQAAKAEFERLKSEIEKVQALEEVEQVKNKLLQKAEEVLAQKQRAAEATHEAKEAWKRAEDSQKEAEEAKTEAQQLKKETQKLKSEAEKAKAEAQKAIKEAEEAKKEAQEAEKKSKEAREKAEQAKVEAKKAKEEKSKAEAGKASAEKSRKDAEEGRKRAEAAAEGARKEAEAAKKRAEDAAREARQAQERAEKAREEAKNAAKKEKSKAEEEKGEQKSDKDVKAEEKGSENSGGEDKEGEKKGKEAAGKNEKKEEKPAKKEEKTKESDEKEQKDAGGEGQEKKEEGS